MPTYAYACSSCQHRFEVHQSFTDDALTDCPECGGRLRKQFGSVGVVFKGSGFYRNDSRDSKKTPAASGAAKSSGDSGTAAASTGSASGSGSSSSGSTSSGAASAGAGSSGGSSSSTPAA